MSLDPLPQARVIKYEPRHHFEVASVVRDGVVEFWCDLSESRQALPANAGKVVVLNMIASVVQSVVDRAIVGEGVLHGRGVTGIGGVRSQQIVLRHEVHGCHV